MLVPDVNLLLYASVDAFPQHPRAAAWWTAALSGSEPIGLAPICAMGFVRIATNRKILTDPMTLAQASDNVRSWLAQPCAELLLPGARHLDLTLMLLSDAGGAGNLTTDAQIAAIGIEHDAVIATNDVDFARFPDVRTVNPLRD